MPLTGKTERYHFPLNLCQSLIQQILLICCKVCDISPEISKLEDSPKERTQYLVLMSPNFNSNSQLENDWLSPKNRTISVHLLS